MSWGEIAGWVVLGLVVLSLFVMMLWGSDE